MVKTLTWISRILVGVLFIISGLIKGNDPLGFSYKLNDYFEVFGMPWMDPFALALAMGICILEVVLGVATLTGSKIKPVSWLLMSLIIFFTFLTFYSAWFNKVTDCGCFGDALKGTIGRSLTPWESFWKDIVLLFFISIIFFAKNRIKPVFKGRADWLILGLSTFFVTAFTLHCGWHLPMMDFRPYAIGKNIPQQMVVPEGAQPDVYKSLLYYEKAGVVKEFTSENYPWNDSTWVWKETKNILVTKGYEPPIHDFKISTFDGFEYTEDMINNPEYSFLLVAYDIKKTDLDVQKEVNEFAKKSLEKGISFTGLTASSYEETDAFRHEVQAMYDYYSADAIMLKTMIRSNPGLILLKQGTVIDIWHHNDFPEFDEVNRKYLKK